MLKDISQIDWKNWKAQEDAVLCFVKNGDELLLIHKKTGLGKGNISGPGGRIETGETPIEAVIRECIEEVGITPGDIEPVADLSFAFTNGYTLFGHVFFAYSFTGKTIETEEADPFWCHVNDIPYDKMWADDILWLPQVLAGKYASGKFIFEDHKILSHELIFKDRK